MQDIDWELPVHWLGEKDRPFWRDSIWPVRFPPPAFLIVKVAGLLLESMVRLAVSSSRTGRGCS